MAWADVIVSEVTRSIAMGDLMGCPHENRAPLSCNTIGTAMFFMIRLNTLNAHAHI